MAWDELLTVDEAAERLRVTPGTLRNWLSAKRLEYVKIGRTTKIRESVLERLVDQHTVAAAED